MKYYEDLYMVPSELKDIMHKLDDILHIYTISTIQNPRNSDKLYSYITYIYDMNNDINDLMKKYKKLKENYTNLLEEETKKKNSIIPELIAQIKVLKNKLSV